MHRCQPHNEKVGQFAKKMGFCIKNRDNTQEVQDVQNIVQNQPSLLPITDISVCSSTYQYLRI